jgi:hypothetical protein
MELRGWLSHVDKIVQPLESVKIKYLVMSPVMDNYEQLGLELFGRSPHPNFIIKIWWVEQG